MYLLGVFDDEHKLLGAAEKLTSEHIKVDDVLTPFAIHGIEDALKMKDSKLDVVAFIFGCIGFLVAFLGMSFINTIDWPNNIGGKPYFALPAFVPISFEITVLFSAVGMVITFFVISKLWPGRKPVIFDKRSTDDKFVMAFDITNIEAANKTKISKLLKDNGAIEINEKDTADED